MFHSALKSNRSWAALIKSFLLSAMVTSTAANADTLGVVDGQAYGPDQFREFSLDIAGRLHADSQRIGVRATLRPIFNNSVAPFFETSSSQGDLDNLTPVGTVKFGGENRGAGFYYLNIPDWRDARAILKVSYTDEENNVDSTITVAGQQAIVDYNQRTLFASLLLSPREALLDNGLNGYLALGLGHYRKRRVVFVDQVPEPRLARDESSIQPYLAAGVVLPYERYHFYAVVEFQQEASLSLGIRWNRVKK